ncbi:hypothetical protein CA13_01410 [Planctomycetes bacterium CA13]|uniref:Uncharacterized protein n=1 Tax=Novipirellula herctigrandis TaxID=2527986 RepID=A0A5C5YUR1_9BACT|nr:hypothetical protein CA13_01410 [Planctomycetes bacterium CA13]
MKVSTRDLTILSKRQISYGLHVGWQVTNSEVAHLWFSTPPNCGIEIRGSVTDVDEDLGGFLVSQYLHRSNVRIAFSFHKTLLT